MNWNIDGLQDAWMLAARLHDGQKYGGNVPDEQVEYLNHIGSVTFEIMAATQHEQEMDAHLALHCAVLHDALEDTSLSYDALQTQFGQAVADGVQALTKNESIDGKPAQMQDSLQRILQQPKAVWAVKLADRICNLYAPAFYWDNAKIQAYQAEARVIHATLKDGSVYLTKRLAEKIQAYDRFLS